MSISCHHFKLQFVWIILCMTHLTATNFPEQSSATVENGTNQYDALDEDFKQACLFVRNERLSQPDKLKIYGLFKCATVGICNTPQPSIFQVASNALPSKIAPKRPNLVMF